MRILYSIVGRDTETQSPAIALPQLTKKIVYLGWFSNDPQTILINHILLLYKYGGRRGVRRREHGSQTCVGATETPGQRT